MRVSGGFRVSDFGFWVSGFGFRALGFGLRVSGLQLMVVERIGGASDARGTQTQKDQKPEYFEQKATLLIVGSLGLGITVQGSGSNRVERFGSGHYVETAPPCGKKLGLSIQCSIFRVCSVFSIQGVGLIIQCSAIRV